MAKEPSSTVNRRGLCLQKRARQLTRAMSFRPSRSLQFCSLAMGFIDDHTAQWRSSSLWAVCQDHLKCCNDNMELENAMRGVSLRMTQAKAELYTWLEAQLPGYKLDWRRWQQNRWSDLGERPVSTIFLFEKRKNRRIKPAVSTREKSVNSKKAKIRICTPTKARTTEYGRPSKEAFVHYLPW